MWQVSIKRIFVNILCLFLLMAVIWAYRDWKTPKFHDVTVELGTKSLSVDAFKTEDAWDPNAAFASDVTGIDLGTIGQTQVVLRHSLQEETVTLTVKDTTPPQADVQKTCVVPVTQFPEASTLVSNIRDASPVKVFYREEPRVPLDYNDLPVTIVLEDASGNQTEAVCTFCFRWMPETAVVELGETVSRELVLYNPERDGGFLDAAELQKARVGGVGEYTITSTWGGKTQHCVLTVQDTQGPELKLRDVQIRKGGRVEQKDFVVKAEDPSGIAEVRLVTPLKRRPAKGKHTVVVEAEDNVGNVTRKEATLYVATEFTRPKISGDLSEVVVQKNGTLPNLLDGIRAKDNLDGSIPVVCDLSGVDLTRGGTYYAVYRAVDSSGNVSTKKRPITVLHDEADTLRMAQEIAQTFKDDDVEGMRRYVYYGIGYNHDWGGNDPIWHGFTEKRGNCYVHANCMKSLLDAKGIENELIWTTNKSHYWLIVKLDGKWKHIEPTPSVVPIPAVMNDSQRLATLSGRTWDRSQWPSCT